ncbi:glycosyltransferase [Nitriliruptoraceae bacterium ZYF776]|nr:glycosyltransferase [Profundirhabdus halotolerans]
MGPPGERAEDDRRRVTVTRRTAAAPARGTAGRTRGTCRVGPGHGRVAPSGGPCEPPRCGVLGSGDRRDEDRTAVPDQDPARRLVRAVRRSAPVRRAAAVTRASRSARLLRDSGRFDEGWYRAQATDGETIDDPVAHYLDVGAAAGWSPHPLFDPATVRANDASASRSDADPFTHFLAGAAARGVDPHPLFDGEVVRAAHPEAARHPQGAFGWYLDDPERPATPPSRVVTRDEAPTPRAYLDLVRRAVAAHAAVPDHTGVARTFPDFDHDAAAAHVAHARAVVAAGSDLPTVSVVVPTMDRERQLPATLDSVLAQSYPHLELLVVDDGSTDATPELLARYAAADPRVRTFRQDNAGVAAARNHGLREARGELVAYLDSDNTWVPEFLEAMVGTLLDTGARAAYAGSELRAEGRLEYRGRPFDREVLVERNYIDCITLVHERALLDEVGGFDEQLRRVVDWDLLIRISAVTPLVYAPFLATSYDLWEEADDRITRFESVGYRYAVRAKHLVDRAAAPPVVAGRTSLLVVARRDDGADVVEGVAALVRDHLAAGDAEVVVVDDGCERDVALRLRLLATAVAGVQLERIADRVNLATALEVAAARASGDVLVVADPVLRPPVAALHACAARVRAEADLAAVQPLWLDAHDGTVAASGQRTGPGGVPVQVGWKLAPTDALVAERPDRDAIDLVGGALDTAWLRRVGGLDPVFTRGGADVDLGWRLRDAGARCEVHTDVWVPVELKLLHRRTPLGPDDARELERRHGTRPATLDAHVADSGVAVSGTTPVPRAAVRGPQRWAPVLQRTAGGRRRWAIKIAAQDVADRESWGDWHFAVALRDALVELGEHAVVDLRRAWYRETAHLDDIDLFLRGTQPYDVPPGRHSLLWIISHPREVTRDEVRRFDHVFAASETFAEDATRRFGRPVEPLLQCTDPARFRPEPDPALATPLLFVGNSRGVRRRIVADAIDAGLEPAIHGRGWEGLVPDHLIRGQHVDNAQLGRYYASAEVVLADHWDDMREHGFVANRLFDAVAAGAAVVSDEVPGADALFGGRVVTYRGVADLPAAIAAARSAHGDPAADVTGHTFLDRARRLVESVDGGDR